MTIFLDEACIAKLVTMDAALAAVEEVFAELGNGHVTNVPRVRAPLNDGILRITAAVLNYRGYYGIKVSSTNVFGRNAGRLFCLYKEEGGELCAVMQVFGLGALRTGAASGIATRHMARTDARVLGVIGSGRQARTQVEAIAMVRPIEEVRAFSRDEERCQRFCRDIASDRQINAKAVATAEAAVRDCDIVVTATTSTAPVLFGEWLRPGTHVNAIGANYEHRRELDLKAVQRANVIAADDLDQVRYEFIRSGTGCRARRAGLGKGCELGRHRGRAPARAAIRAEHYAVQIARRGDGGCCARGPGLRKGGAARPRAAPTGFGGLGKPSCRRRR